MNNKEKKYGHVGRPTNEEVKKIKQKKTLKIVLMVLCTVLVIGGLFLYFNRESLELSTIMGDATASKRIMTYKGSDGTTAYVVSCPTGYKLRYNYGDSKVKNVETRQYYCQRSINSNNKKDATVLKIPFYVQNDFKSTLSRCGGGKLNVKGCLPTVGAMVFSALLEKDLKPTDINSDAYGYTSSSVCSSNSYKISFLENYAKSNDIEVTIYSGNNSTNRENIIEKLRTGNCIGVAALERKKFCSSGAKNLCYAEYGHFVMFYANSTYSSKVYVNDPALKKDKYGANTIKYAIKSYKLSDIISSAQNDKVRLFCR